MDESTIRMAGTAEVLDINALCQYIQNLSAEDAESLCERFSALRRQQVPHSKKDAVENAISEFFHVWTGTISDIMRSDWMSKQGDDVKAYQKFFGYCRDFEQTPKVGFWAEGAFA